MIGYPLMLAAGVVAALYADQPFIACWFGVLCALSICFGTARKRHD